MLHILNKFMNKFCSERTTQIITQTGTSSQIEKVDCGSVNLPKQMKNV